MVIDHIGIAVSSIHKGIDHWEKTFGYRQATDIIENTRQKVLVTFLEKPESTTVKLIQPTEESSPVYRFAKKGGGLHHLCFKGNDIDTDVSRFKELGLRVLTDPQPGEAFDNEKIAFIYAGQGLNIELIDTEKKAGRKEAKP
ncbi:MAG: hypothetical protein GF401_19230 [Chitinivibrionales bacterium]|nr:hypothetical protein [Chitinivibrionales bacterium]